MDEPTARFANGRRPSNEVASRPLRIALYSHETLGLGHIRRNLLIAGALTRAFPQAAVLLVTGAVESLGLPLPARVDCLALPSLRIGDDLRYEPRRLPIPLEALLAVRSRALAGALDAFEPDLIVVDKVPRGASLELAGTLELARRRGVRLVLGLRDVVENPARMRTEWSESGAEAAIRDLYDEVWIYGDANVHDLRRDAALPADLDARFRFTGYLCGGRIDPEPGFDPLEGLRPGRLALCLVGGGEDGAPLGEAFLKSELPRDMSGVALLGPFMPEADVRRLTALADGTRRRVLRSSAGTSFLTKRADRVIAMAGYNTVCELLALGSEALLVPRGGPLHEQRIRAARLAALGHVDVLLSEDLSPDRLAAWLDLAITPRSRVAIDLGGTERIPRLAERLLVPRRTGEPG